MQVPRHPVDSGPNYDGQKPLTRHSTLDFLAAFACSAWRSGELRDIGSNGLRVHSSRDRFRRRAWLRDAYQLCFKPF
jgi:hypothetical protein